MPRMPLHLASGNGIYAEWAPKTIRLVRYGCTNRPFYHIVVMTRFHQQRWEPIEQLGTYDPCENQFNEKLAAFNFERIQWWLGRGNVDISKPVERLLGLSGFLPIHPTTYMTAWRNRRKADEEASSAKDTDEKKATATP
ncbi:probable 28S ribosomal protein S16, mitochondrial [Venturia canescens]|uniref:probable 28S ribosomal protein S16, mitochondrial n=1 Tax=Venturia canescens TaxID=32260 RepID=UPI001C9C7505|nr:probable 28S ribosomal protein S16, mitochondrial [Venturia canescens]